MKDIRSFGLTINNRAIAPARGHEYSTGSQNVMNHEVQDYRSQIYKTLEGLELVSLGCVCLQDLQCMTPFFGFVEIIKTGLVFSLFSRPLETLN